MNVGDIADDPKAKVLSRGAEKGCKINGVSVGDCSTVKIGDIANDLHAKVLSRGEGESKSCEIKGVSVLVCLFIPMSISVLTIIFRTAPI